MGEHSYEVGDRVRRCDNFEASDDSLRRGDVAKLVSRTERHEGSWLVRVERNGQSQVWADRYFEPLTDAPAEPARLQGVRVNALALEHADVRAAEIANRTAQELAAQVRAEQLAREQAYSRTAPVEPCTRGLRSELADVKGERDQLKERLAFAEDDVRWYRREVVRLGGRVRPERKR
jgi:hypothetical protein